VEVDSTDIGHAVNIAL